MNVMQLSMMGPSQCANELATQNKSSDSNNSDTGTASASSTSAAEAAE